MTMVVMRRCQKCGEMFDVEEGSVRVECYQCTEEIKEEGTTQKQQMAKGMQNLTPEEVLLKKIFGI